MDHDNYQNPAQENPEFNDNIADHAPFTSDEGKSLIKVIGVGGGGGNAVNYMFRQDIPDINFVVLNTDDQHLKKSPVPNKLTLGFSITHGRGAGNKPEIGRKCAEASADDIRKLFDDGTEMVFITAGMGGGTGTGAAPVVARIAREAGMLTIGIVTVPFLFEGELKILKAIEGAEEMRKHVDALLVINNQNLLELHKDLNFFNAFEKADDTLANAARSISEIISEECYINVDFEDVKTILKDSGTAIISTATGEGEHRLSDAIHNALHSPLLKTHDIKTSKRLLLKFSCNRLSPNALKAEEINEITEFTGKLPRTIDVKWGIADDPSLGDKVKITVLASGFDVTIREKSAGGDDDIITFGAQAETDGQIGVEKRALEEQNNERIAEVYGMETITRQRQTAARMRYAILKPSQFDDHEIISMIERTPTFNRDSRFNQELAGYSDAKAAQQSVIETPASAAEGEAAAAQRPDQQQRPPAGTITFG